MISGIAQGGRRRRSCAAVVAVLGAGVLATGVLGGCSVDRFIIDPGHYSVYHCKDLATRLTALQARQKELSELMNKASDGGASGTVIANLSYRGDYENAIGEEQVLRRAAAEKKCDLPPPANTAMAPTAPPPSPSTPAAYVAPPSAAAPPTTATVPVFQSDQTIR
jgi:outer membrane murein-binding lipoprotein Lpp